MSGPVTPYARYATTSAGMTAVFGVYGMTAIAALTAQNTQGVTAVHVVPPDFVRAQIDAVVSDIGCDAVKTGMLATAAIVATVASAVRAHRLRNLVVDPVMLAHGGAALLDDAGRAALLAELLPLASLVTPNIPEAEVLTAMRIDSVLAMHEAARALLKTGVRACLIKGGHLQGPQAIDVFYEGNTGLELNRPRLDTIHTHGTGCQLSAAIAANLALGLDLRSAVERAKLFITTAIEHGLAIGHGTGPANPMAWTQRSGGHLATASGRRRPRDGGQ